jgi:hypothetical protein
MFQEDGLKMFTKGLPIKMIHATFFCTMFYLSMNKIGKMFDTNLSDLE